MSQALPEPVLRETVSFTPLAHFKCQKMGPGRVFFDCIVRVEALGRGFARRELPAPPLDLVHVDLDATRVHATFRLVLDPRDGVAVVVLRAFEENASC